MQSAIRTWLDADKLRMALCSIKDLGGSDCSSGYQSPPRRSLVGNNVRVLKESPSDEDRDRSPRGESLRVVSAGFPKFMTYNGHNGKRLLVMKEVGFYGQAG